MWKVWSYVNRRKRRGEEEEGVIRKRGWRGKEEEGSGKGVPYAMEPSLYLTPSPAC